MALGYSPDDFIKAHKRAALRAQQNALEDDDFATVLVDFLNSIGEVEGYAMAVLEALREYAADRGIGRGVLPQAPNAFSRRLKEITKYLELAGWQCELLPLDKRGRPVTFTRLSPAEPDVDQEVDLAPALEPMGHASVKMTVDQYYHLLGGEKRRTIAKLPSLSKPEDAPAPVAAASEPQPPTSAPA